MPDRLDDAIAGIEASTTAAAIPLIMCRTPVEIPGRTVDVVVFNCPVPNEDGRARRGELFIAVAAPAGQAGLVPVLPAYVTTTGARVPGVPAWPAIGMSLISPDQALTDARTNLLTAPTEH